MDALRNYRRIVCFISLIKQIKSFERNGKCINIFFKMNAPKPGNSFKMQLKIVCQFQRFTQAIGDSVKSFLNVSLLSKSPRRSDVIYARLTPYALVARILKLKRKCIKKRKMSIKSTQQIRVNVSNHSRASFERLIT